MFAFGNEVALLCEAAGIDAGEVIRSGKTGYPRTNIALPGFVGGPCLEKDPHILEHALKDFGFRPELISTGRRLNEELPMWVAKSLSSLLKDKGDKLKIAICGMAFKGRPETDDLRGTPSILLAEALKQTFPEATIVGQDFAVAPSAIQELGLPSATIDEAFADADAVVIANNNSKYEWIELDRLVGSMAKPSVIYDCWSVLQTSAADMPEGVKYLRLGSIGAALAKEKSPCMSS